MARFATARGSTSADLGLLSRARSRIYSQRVCVIATEERGALQFAVTIRTTLVPGGQHGDVNANES